MDANSVAVKIGFNGDLHRLRVDLNVFTLDELTRLFARTFGLAPGSFVIKYTDAEGDALNVVSDAEFVEACRVFLSGNRDELKALKFTAVLREGGARLATAGTAADQLIDAVERLVVSLNTTVDKVRADDWKAVEATTAVLSQAAHEAHETLQATRQAMQEKRFEQVLEETSDGVKSAASGISSFAQRLVKNFIPEKKPEAANQSQSQSPPAPAVVQPEEKVEEAPAQQEQEEVVFTAVPEPEVAVPAPAAPVAAPVAFSEAEIKWAEQLGMIRGIFPDVETQNAINLLEANQGDVNIVINELMESIM